MIGNHVTWIMSKYSQHIPLHGEFPLIPQTPATEYSSADHPPQRIGWDLLFSAGVSVT